MSFKKIYKLDLFRYGGGGDSFTKNWLFFFRKAQCSRNKFVRKLYTLLYQRMSCCRGIEISHLGKIGSGLYLGHFYNITINAGSVIGKNCNIHKGVTIGRENRGKREGCPIIGDKVWIGINAVVCGSIKIGNDVMIAANSFVNQDVPSHSIVIGNPCIIIPKENATEGYVEFIRE